MRSGADACTFRPEHRPYRFPFTPFPSGWFAVAWGREIARGGVRAEHAFGRDLVIFRDDGEEVHVLDAACPHLGAHLGCGGRVEGNTIRCPFHGWRFDATGSCVEVPFQDTPSGVRVRSWPVREVDGMVLVWHDVAGRDPNWIVRPKHTDDWPPLTLTEDCNWVVRTHPQELVENAADSAHLPFVHGLEPGARRTSLFDGPRAQLQFATTVDVSALGFSGISRFWIDVVVQGLGLLQVDIDVVDFGVQFRTLIHVTPIDGEHVRVRAPLSARHGDDVGATHAILDAWRNAFRVDFETDAVIWENKQYLSRPRLSRVDGPVIQLREWARQFYPD